MRQRLLLSGLLIAFIRGFAAADDGWIGYSGSPKLMASHPSVRMVSEVVRVTIHRQTADVVCDFVFRNAGSACDVRMGFPDYSGNRMPGDANKSVFMSFKSTVDGKRVDTTLEPAKAPEDADFNAKGWNSAFQVKSVHFGKGQTRRVRDSYQVRLGTVAIHGEVPGKGEPAERIFSYIFSTGGSWHGSIGRAEMVITFADDAPIGKGKLALTKGPLDYDKLWEWRVKHPHAVGGAQSGFDPRGRTLRLLKKNWKPTKRDDVELAVGMYYRK
ncbi:MAG TPA: hypothetical protein VHE55_01090 [Fimbriimonadaceae bacterium]|nr:hypothetical protein [Fimbriimonadaceae bacterium]